MPTFNNLNFPKNDPRIENRIAAAALILFAIGAAAVIIGESGTSHFEVGILNVGPAVIELPALRWSHMREGLGWMGLFSAVLVMAAAVIRNRRFGLVLFTLLAVTTFLAGMFTVSALAALRPQAHDIRDQLLYYLGAVYYDEIGYNDLNRCIIESAMELGVAPPDRYQDLATNTVVNTRQRLASEIPCRNRFSTVRWEAFRTDVGGFTPGLVAWKGQWQRTLLDYGFNGTPVLRRLISAAAVVFPATHRGLTLIALLNLAAMLTGLFAVLAWIGPRESLVCALLLFVFPGDSFIHLWSIPRYFWIAAILTAIALLYRGGKWAVPAAGALLAFSAGLKAFPLAWMAGPSVLAGAALLRRNKTPAVRLIAGAAAAAAVLFIWSIADAHHLANWTEFAFRMRLNGNRPTTGCIGFAYNFLHPIQGPTYNMMPALHGLHAKLLGPITLLHLQRTVQLLLSLAVLRACLRLDCARASMLSGFGLLFIWCIPVNYYYTGFLGLPLLFSHNRSRLTFAFFGAWLLISAGVSGLMIEHVDKAVLYVKFLSTNFTLFLVAALTALELEALRIHVSIKISRQSRFNFFRSIHPGRRPMRSTASLYHRWRRNHSPRAS